MLNQKEQQEKILAFFKQSTGKTPSSIHALPPSGSDRKYYRISYDSKSILGAYNPVEEENTAFIHFTKHFRSLQLPVPEVIDYSEKENIYLLEDLGDTTLFSLLPHHRDQICFDDTIMNIYKKILDVLPVFQVKGAKNLDFSVCFPRHAFDRNSMMWDLNYFKYYFLKLAGIMYNEQKLEEDFQALCDYLLESKQEYFLYRDFQSRNIMIKDNKPWFIDYQGGRKGALQYDIASLLYDAKANIHPSQRVELLNYYIQSLQKQTQIEEVSFKNHYYGFVLIRIMQAMGAYGFRGFYEKKPLFLQSIPYAKRNLRWLLEKNKIPEQTPYLQTIAEKIINSEALKKYDKATSVLKVSIRSFSYRKGLPPDESGNGGGFVFDCRSLPNPGREDVYKQMTGKDQPVIEYLEKEPSVLEFADNTSKIVENSINVYLKRGFTHLMVSYGCTGGQHRSVFNAERLAKRINEKFDVMIDLKHEEEINWPGL